MCAKFTQVVSRMIGPGPVKEGLKSSYYRLYYNAKHSRENGFRVYYGGGHFEYAFDGGVRFSSYENFADELKRSLRGYLASRPLRPGDIVVDCGAYVGEFTLYAAAAVGSSGAVIAFEPDPCVFRKLEANIKLNSFSNVRALNKGVWSEDGRLKFVGDSVKGYSFMSAENDEAAISVPVVSLDNELGRMGVSKVDFIKMDIEGAEVKALEGAREVLRKGASLAIASYHMVDGKKSCAELEKVLVAAGYRAETGHPRHLTTYGTK